MADNRRAMEKWLQQQLPRWRDAASHLSTVERSRRASLADVMDSVHSYGEIARGLSVARQVTPGGKLTRYLEQVYARYHRALFRKPGSAWRSLRDIFLVDGPAIAWQLRQQIMAVSLLFVLSALGGWWLVSRYPELAALFASEDMINGVANGELWTDNILNVVPSPILAVSILSNNIVVALSAMCLGVFYGLGTFYIITLNGLMLGGVFAMTAQHNLAMRLLVFVIAHGIVELSVICIAGAIGVSLGGAIARPGNRTRIESFHLASVRCAKLILVCSVFLAGAGFIEGFVSPNPDYSLALKASVGVAYMAVFVATLAGTPQKLVSALQAG